MEDTKGIGLTLTLFMVVFLFVLMVSPDSPPRESLMTNVPLPAAGHMHVMGKTLGVIEPGTERTTNSMGQQPQPITIFCGTAKGARPSPGDIEITKGNGVKVGGVWFVEECITEVYKRVNIE